VAEALRNEPGLEVEVVNGKRGQLAVQLDGDTVAKKVFFFFTPSVEKVVGAVRRARASQAKA
jgi:hypothetical protein